MTEVEAVFLSVWPFCAWDEMQSTTKSMVIDTRTFLVKVIFQSPREVGSLRSNKGEILGRQTITPRVCLQLRNKLQSESSKTKH
jgi:hypothetical protein